MSVVSFFQKIKIEMTKNASLKREKSELVKARDRLKAAIDDHMKYCKKSLEKS